MFYQKFINMAQYRPELEHKLDQIEAKTIELTNGEVKRPIEILRKYQKR